MSMVLNEVQIMLKDSSSEFCKTKSPITEFRKLRDDKGETGFSRALWAEMVEMGWTGAIFPEELSGYDFGFQGMGVIIEETGRSLVSSPLLSSVVLSGSLVMNAGSDEQKQEIIPAIISGERLITVAVDESHTHNPSNIACTATKSGEGYVISGEKRFVVDGHVANQFVVVTRTSGDTNDESGITLFLVDADAEGISTTRTHMVDSKNSAMIKFDNVSVDATSILGTIDGGFAPLSDALDRARICLAAEMLGAIMQTYETTIEYLKTRVQFNVPIGSFQALQHRAADMFGDVEMARAIVLEALTAIDEGSDQVPLLASLAKAKLNDIFEHVSNEGIQLHGGIGMTDECDIGFYLKRSRVASETFGSSQLHRNRYATLKGY
jgi:alkylation response protein AidB-like acyl-CoA dehydrogenase